MEDSKNKIIKNLELRISTLKVLIFGPGGDEGIKFREDIKKELQVNTKKFQFELIEDVLESLRNKINNSNAPILQSISSYTNILEDSVITNYDIVLHI
jgi:hypothetical protein